MAKDSHTHKKRDKNLSAGRSFHQFHKVDDQEKNGLQTHTEADHLHPHQASDIKSTNKPDNQIEKESINSSTAEWSQTATNGNDVQEKTYAHTSKNNRSVYQLQQWAHTISDAEVTLAEKLEKQKWETERN